MNGEHLQVALVNITSHQARLLPRPRGVTAPSPVITTLRIAFSDDEQVNDGVVMEMRFSISERKCTGQSAAASEEHSKCSNRYYCD
jgi:hypothetical protein